MEKKDHTKYWIITSEHDRETAEALFLSGRYDACLFFGHLMIEKILKALWINTHEEGLIPPKTHNLLKIAIDAKIDIDNNTKAALLRIDGFNLETRYPDYRLSFYKLCTKDFTEKQFIEIKELYSCLRNQLQLN